jgi:hypothetical protein
MRSIDCLATDTRAPASCRKAAGATRPMSKPRMAITTSSSSKLRHYGATAINYPNYAANSMTCSEVTYIRRRPTITH